MTTGTAHDVTQEIQDFLVHEADLLDSNRQNEWLDLLHDEFVYRVPVPVSREEPTQSQHDAVLEFANESKSFLSMRFARTSSDYAWSERPPAFVRHFVTNFRIATLREDEAWTVRTNVLLARGRQPDPLVLSSAERVDRIERNGERLLLHERVVYLDMEVPTAEQLGAIY